MTLNVDIEAHEAFEAQSGFKLTDHLVYAGYGGTKAHNTYTPPGRGRTSVDDVDIVCIVVPPPKLDTWTTHRFRHSLWDFHTRSLAWFTKELIQGSPFALEVLWSHKDSRLQSHPCFQPFFDKRSIFRSQAALTRFRHIPKAALDIRDDYEGWHYPAARKQLAERFGFDAWAGSNIIQSLTRCIELAKTGSFDTFRDDDKDLVQAIKTGYFKRHEVESMMGRLSNEADQAIAATKLPEVVDLDAANALLFETLQAFWQLKRTL